MSDLEKYKNIINHGKQKPDDELSDFLIKSNSLKVPSKKSKEEIWQTIIENIEEKGEKKSINWRLIGIAASIALLATFALLFFNQPSQIDIIAQQGQTISENLPDGSQVILNASSSISYSYAWNRELTLEGEAFFEVTKGEKFLVKTTLGKVQVLGTSFNVFARNENFEVSCKTGKVKVSIPAKSFEETIEPGQIISLKADSIKRITRLPELMGKWNAGEFYFNHQPINEVFEELQRQFSIEIEYEESMNDEFSGYFTNKSVINALDMVCLPLGLEYQKTGQNTFSISKSSK
jgi:ferric-dicitrate binding protein FerR (iron transport regulator)